MRHIIPVNISSDGNVLGGMFKKKNAIEAGIHLLLCFLLMKLLFIIPVIPRIIIYVCIGVFPAFIMLIGIGDQSFTEWVRLKIRYSRAKDIIPYEVQTENNEEAPTDIIERYKWKREKKKERKAEKKESRRRGKEFDKKQKELAQMKKRTQGKPDKKEKKKKQKTKKAKKARKKRGKKDE